MTFYVYQKERNLFVAPNETTLAGEKSGLIFKTWCKLKKNEKYHQVWTVIEDGLVKIWNTPSKKDNTRIIIDLHPNAKDRCFIAEVVNMWAYTHNDLKKWGNEHGLWTVLMLQLRILINDSYPDGNALEKKNITEIRIPKDNKEILTEFLYLKKWNWGSNGRANGALICPEVLDEFKKKLFE